MQKKIFAALGITLLLFACSKEELPENLIPKEKMIRLVEDVQIGEQLIKKAKYNERDSLARRVYGKIFELNKVEEEHFYESLKYYQDRPELAFELYNGVLDSLNIRRKGK